MSDCSRITAFAPRSMGSKFIELCKEMNIKDVYRAQASLPRLKSLGLLSSFTHPLVFDPAEVFTFLCESTIEHKLLAYLNKHIGFQAAGCGALFSQQLKTQEGHVYWYLNRAEHLQQHLNDVSSVEEEALSGPLVGITCVLQRGQADAAVQQVLESSAVPIVTYGIGKGIRDKLGLLRITISKEKEILRCVVHQGEAEYFYKLLIRSARLDEPGKGFISLWPIQRGTVPVRAQANKQKNAATYEQIIAAIDGIKGDLNWRRRQEEFGQDEFKSFSGLDLNLFCNEGASTRLLEHAMACGLDGAVIEQWNLIEQAAGHSTLSPARELCNMTINPAKLESIMASFTRDEAFTDGSGGIALYGQIDQAFTYTIPK